MTTTRNAPEREKLPVEDPAYSAAYALGYFAAARASLAELGALRQGIHEAFFGWTRALERLAVPPEVERRARALSTAERRALLQAMGWRRHGEWWTPPWLDWWLDLLHYPPRQGEVFFSTARATRLALMERDARG